MAVRSWDCSSLSRCQALSFTSAYLSNLPWRSSLTGNAVSVFQYWLYVQSLPPIYENPEDHGGWGILGLRPILETDEGGGELDGKVAVALFRTHVLADGLLALKFRRKVHTSLVQLLAESDITIDSGPSCHTRLTALLEYAFGVIDPDRPTLGALMD